MRKAIVWIIVIVVVAVIGFRIYQARQRTRKETASEGATAMTVAVIEPRVGDISYTLSFVGNIKGKDQVQVFSEAPGKLIRYTVNEGDKISKDEVIALIDRSVTGMEFEPFKVKSPISGVIGKLLLDQGSSIVPQIPVAVVVKMDKVKAVFNVGEKDLSKIRKGMYAEIRVDAYPDETFKGRVTRISPVVDPMSRSASCEVLLTNPRYKLKPGMFAEIEVLVEVHRSALLVPEDVVIKDLKQGINYIFLLEDSVARKREVELGISSGDTVEIVSGLNGGETVISKGQNFLQDGKKVKIAR